MFDDERRHVRRASPRVKAHRLTRRAERIARDIAERADGSMLPPTGVA